tara:strand:- start:2331 stop:2570 length:240 start_codon:yes stop_codon:yes gene_type:complete
VIVTTFEIGLEDYVDTFFFWLVLLEQLIDMLFLFFDLLNFQLLLCLFFGINSFLLLFADGHHHEPTFLISWYFLGLCLG